MVEKKLAVISLGCDKNLVDSEVLIGGFADEGFSITNDLIEADYILLNTCSFISDARDESNENIKEIINIKKSNPKKKLILAGCYVQSHKQELVDKHPEIDGFIGVNDIDKIGNLLTTLEMGLESDLYVSKDIKSFDIKSSRIVTSQGASTFIKIAEGCSNCCSYCAIPSIRGPFRSRTIEDIIVEAQDMSELGIKELILVAQDTGSFGEDRGKNEFIQLLTALEQVEGIEWIRILYLYPDHLTDQLISKIAGSSKIVNYLDIPLQHVSEEILKAMNRTGDVKKYSQLIDDIRLSIPDVVIRSTFIVGFPGETDEHFNEMYQFLEEKELDKAGFFPYSKEDGTVAAEMKNQVDCLVVEKRLESLASLQELIFINKNKALIGQEFDVIPDSFDVGRYYGQTMSVDGVVVVPGAMMDTDKLYRVKIVSVDEENLIGELI